MNAAALRQAVLHTLLKDDVLADTMEDGLDMLIDRLGQDLSRTAIATSVQEAVREHLVYEPVRLPAGALQCHWHLELTPEGRLEARQTPRRD